MESLDVFDTAIFRDVYQPTDIFYLVEQKVGGNFKKLRIDAEARARREKPNYNIDDIYKYIPGFDKKVEIQMELDHVYANTDMLNMYKRNPKNYVFISDMYLPSSIIKQMLEKCGYTNVRVFVSCEEKCNKGSGSLFKQVARKVGDITKHYGDNYNSDIQGAAKANIEPVYKAALHKMPLNLPSVKDPMLKKYAALLESTEMPALHKLAKYYAPLIYGFTKWVVQQRKPGQSIYFLSRDMFMPYLICKSILKETDIHYLYCSRRSLSPLFINSDNSELINKAKIVLSADEYRYKKFKQAEVLKYLNRKNIKTGDIIVDIGYSGSTQYVLEKFLNVRLKGLYIQLDQVPMIHQQMDMRMYLDRYALTYRFLAEFIFTSPEDNIEDYKNSLVMTSPDHEQRKKYAKHINSIILNEDLYKELDRMNLSVFDVEQMLIHVQQYPSKEIMDLFNEPILTNRSKMERGINFDREAIKKGNLLQCYSRSYAKPLFKIMLQQDKELSGLEKLLP